MGALKNLTKDQIAARTITLTNVEQALVLAVAALRYLSNRAGGVLNAKKGPQSEFFTEVTGLGAEVGSGRWFNVYPDLTISVRKGGYDWIWHRLRIDVKTTDRDDNQLIVDIEKEDDLEVDLYLLVVNHWPDFIMVGMARREVICQKSNIKDLGWGDLFALEQEHLDFRHVEYVIKKRGGGDGDMV